MEVIHTEFLTDMRTGWYLRQKPVGGVRQVVSSTLPFPFSLPFPFPFPYILSSFPYPLPSSTHSPLPFPTHCPPLPLPLPHFAASGSGERLSSPSGSGRSPAAKRFLVLFELKILHLWSLYLTCQRQAISEPAGRVKDGEVRARATESLTRGI